MKLLFCCLVLGIFALNPLESKAQPQERPMSVHSLENMDGFRPVAGNWRIAGNASADRHTTHQITASDGDGVLVNIPSEGARENLFFDWEHGDIELELEFMMPKGSNAGIYLQGRYEIQMFDSWGVSRPTFADAGGIYQRWDPDRASGQRGYQGHPPQMNVSRAPGLWQQFQIRFQAPRFDGDGRKVSNAKMVRVVHNGVVIHENVELTGPTTSAAFQDEQAMGPLMIQGDHGPVAVRNIRYKRYQPNLISISDTKFQQVAGLFDSVPDFPAFRDAVADPIEGIDWRVSVEDHQMAMRFSGNMHIPYTGEYRFQLELDWITGDPHFQNEDIGGGKLVIGSNLALEHAGKNRTGAGEIELEAGVHPYSLTIYKNRGGRNSRPRMALYAEGTETPLHALNAPGSLPEPRMVPSIYVRPTAEPALIRGFINHGGKKKTHTIAVGHPSGVHYTMDLRQGGLLHAWKGDFIETTDMWHSRGQAQLAVPLGGVLTFSGEPTVAHLATTDAAWPDSMDTSYTFKGYELDADGHPSFMYIMANVAVSDHLSPEEGGRHLRRKLTLHGDSAHEGYWVRVASGSDIAQLDEGGYSVDGNSYYVTLDEAHEAQAVIRSAGEGQELLVPFSMSDGEAAVRYTLVW